MTTPAAAADRSFLASVEDKSNQQSLPVLLPPRYAGPVGPGHLVQQTGPLDDQQSQSADSDEDSMEVDVDCPDQTPWLRGLFRVPATDVRRGEVIIAGGAWLRNVIPADRLAALALHDQLSDAGPKVVQLVRAGLDVARRAQGADVEARQRMTEFFGPRPAIVAPGEDWWRGVLLILQQIERYLVHPMHLYYGGPEVRKNTPEYPCAGVVDWGRTESGETMNAVANCVSGACDLVIVLRKDGCTRTQLLVPTDGFSSIAGILLHELTHNICGTEDHKFQSGTVVSGLPEALMFARYVPAKAWYNAYNLEFFCEDADGDYQTEEVRDQALELVEANHQQMLAREQK